MNQLIVMEKDVLSKDILQPTCQIVTTGCRERRAREMLLDEHIALKLRASRTEQELKAIQVAMQRPESSKGLSEAERGIISMGVQDRLALADAERIMRRQEAELHEARVEADVLRAEKQRMQGETDRLLMLRNMDGSEMDVEVKEKQKLLQKLRSETDVLRRHSSALQADTATLTGSYNSLAHNHNALTEDIRTLHDAYRALLYEYGKHYPAVAKRLPQGYSSIPPPRKFLAWPWARRKLDIYAPVDREPEAPQAQQEPQEQDIDTAILRKYGGA